MTAHRFLTRAARGARTFTAISAAGAALSFAAMTAAPAAHAATGPARPAAASKVLSTAGHQAAPAVITCKIFVVIRFPHPESVCQAGLGSSIEQPDPDPVHTDSVQPRGTLAFRVSDVPPTEVTYGEVAG